MTNKPKFTRHRNIIRNNETGEVTTFKSRNAAKRESRAIQIRADGALGRGTLRVI